MNIRKVYDAINTARSAKEKRSSSKKMVREFERKIPELTKMEKKEIVEKWGGVWSYARLKRI